MGAALPADLPDDHPAWELEARYLAFGLANFACTLSPARILVGGGVRCGGNTCTTRSGGSCRTF